MTADGEQTGQDAKTTNERAKSLGQLIKVTLQAAEGKKEKMPVVSRGKESSTFLRIII